MYANSAQQIAPSALEWEKWAVVEKAVERVTVACTFKKYSSQYKRSPNEEQEHKWSTAIFALFIDIYSMNLIFFKFKFKTLKLFLSKTLNFTFNEMYRRFFPDTLVNRLF